jgi:hypothetical protein
MRRSAVLVFFIGLFIATTGSLFAQSQIASGTIQGVASDPSGAVVPNAVVTLRHVETGIVREVGADDVGRFAALLLPVGEYEITATATGFSAVRQTGIVLALGQVLTLNFQFSPQGVIQEVEVTEAASLVETTRTETTALVDFRSVTNLPLNGRRFLDLAFLTPGVSQDPERNQLVFAGQRGINSNINIDGADFNQPFFGGQRGGERTNDAFVVSAEAIREFQVIRSGFSPEYGRSTGGVVNVITKSGSNEFHGSAFYFLRHKEFSPRAVSGDAPPIRHQFGATVGGPIKRERAFFFGSYEGQQQELPLVVRFGTTTGLPAEILAKQGTFLSTNDVNTFLGKVDWQLTSSTLASVRYNHSRNDALNGTFSGVTTGVLENNGTEKDRTHTVVGSLNTVISPRVLNEFRTQYSYEDRPRVNNGEDMSFTSKVGPQVQITGCCFLGGVSFLPIPQNDARVQVANNLSVISGPHQMKFGADYNRSTVDQFFRGNWRGVYIFNNVQNYLNAVNRVPGAAADQFRVFFGQGDLNVGQTDFAVFFQDAWKANSRLSITTGLRYEASFNPQPVRPNPLLSPTSQIPSDKKEWQPRLGLTYDLTGDGKTLFRGSAGIFHARTPMLLFAQAFNSNGNPDVGVSFTLNATQIRQAQSFRPEFVFPFVPDTSKAQNASFFTAAGIAGLRPDATYFDPEFRNPRSFNTTLAIEREALRNVLFSVEWAHSNTVRLERIRDVNLFPPTLSLDTSNPPVLRPRFNVSVRPNPNFNIIRSMQSSARSTYDAFTLTLNKRYSRKFQILSYYTLGYNRDNDSNERNFAGITYENAFDLQREFRWSRNDIRHRWVLSGTSDLPFGILSSGILTYRSGLPFSAFTGVDSNGDSQFTDKPIINGVPLLRNTFRQPNYFNVDMRVSKSFMFHEDQRIELMFDLFNVLGKDNYFYRVSSNESTTTAVGSRWGTGPTPVSTFRSLYLPDGTFNGAGAGKTSPFQMQAALRYTF